MTGKVIWIMDASKDDIRLMPPDIQRLVRAADSVGFCNFWYHPEYGLLADAPNAHMEDDRILVSWEEIERHRSPNPAQAEGEVDG